MPAPTACTFKPEAFMDLFEFESKMLLAEFGISVPAGRLLTEVNQPAPMDFPFVLKGQVLSGGRGKAGAIKPCSDDAEYKAKLGSIMQMSVKGHNVQAVLAEEMADISHEYYFAVTLKGTGAQPLLIIGAMGGMDIEEAARSNPDSIMKVKIDPVFGIKPYQLRQAAKMTGLEEGKLSCVAMALYRAFICLDATLVEVNPLAMTDKGLVALDAKVSLDEKAAYRHKALYDRLAEGRRQLPRYTPPIKEETTITYVQLDGNVGLISDGAGTGMMTLDMIHDAGGKVASFCELGGITNEDVMYKAMKLTMEGRPSSVVVVLIGGFNRMDDMAKGIIRYKAEFGLDVPVFTRMCGTMEEDGKRLMADGMMPLEDDLSNAVIRAVAAAGV